MNEQQALMKQSSDNLPGQWLDTGWVPPEHKLSLADWGNAVEKLAAVTDAIHWWVGDIINYGERIYGETYSQWLDLFSYSTVSRDAWVCREIPREIRRSPFGPNKVPFSTHVILAPQRYSIEEKDWWLGLCEAERWSGERLKSQIRQNEMLMSGECEDRANDIADALKAGLPVEDFIHLSKFVDNGRDRNDADDADDGRFVWCPHCGGRVALPAALLQGEVKQDE